MILLYHKIFSENQKSFTKWWVSSMIFKSQILILQKRGAKFVYLSDYDVNNPDQICITFDGVYSNVIENAVPILKEQGIPFELFLVGDFIGKTNDFDIEEPPCRFATFEELKLGISHGGRIQWHSKTHQLLNSSNIINELTVDVESIGPKCYEWFAYPHGQFDNSMFELVGQKFKGAVACENGNDYYLSLKRYSVFEDNFDLILKEMDKK